MTGYEYGNARLKVMKSRLLSKRNLEAMVEIESLNGLISTLTKTPYRNAVEAALARTSGLECIAEALHFDLIGNVGKVRTFFDGEAGEMVAIALRSYDIHNLKAILRGLSRNASPGEILMTVIPVGELRYSILADLTRVPGPRAAIDMLASMNLPFAQPLLKLRTLRRGAETYEMELALDKWHFEKAFQFLRASARSAKILTSALYLEADLLNLLTVIRFILFPSERKHFQERFGTEDLTYLLVGPGHIPFALLSQAGSRETIDTFINDLSGTIYAPTLRAGLGAYGQSSRLSVFEKQLRRFRLHWMSGLISKDPLGIGVLLGYLSLKVNEISNLRWIAQGIDAGLKADSLRAEIVWGG